MTSDRGSRPRRFHEWLRLFIGAGVATMLIAVIAAVVTGANVYIVWSISWGVWVLFMTYEEARRVRP